MKQLAKLPPDVTSAACNKSNLLLRSCTELTLCLYAKLQVALLPVTPVSLFVFRRDVRHMLP